MAGLTETGRDYNSVLSHDPKALPVCSGWVFFIQLDLSARLP